jgi:hypothetical protein
LVNNFHIIQKFELKNKILVDPGTEKELKSAVTKLFDSL